MLRATPPFLSTRSPAAQSIMLLRVRQRSASSSVNPWNAEISLRSISWSVSRIRSGYSPGSLIEWAAHRAAPVGQDGVDAVGELPQLVAERLERFGTSGRNDTSGMR